jgi:hypothetical protein
VVSIGENGIVIFPPPSGAVIILIHKRSFPQSTPTTHLSEASKRFGQQWLLQQQFLYVLRR